MVDRKMEENIAQFCGVTGASVKDAKKFLEKYKRVDVAVDAYYGDPTAFAAPAPAAHTGRTPHGPSTSKINAVFDKYKDPDSTDDSITVDGTIRLCEDLGVNPEDVVLLAVAYELKSPHVGEWGRAGWVEGWKAIGADTLPTMAAALPRLRTKLASDAAYFTKVYNHTFEFARAEGQRSIGIDTAQAFWALLLPHGMSGGAISHTATDGSGDVDMNGKHTAGFAPEHVDWWFEFLGTHGGKGVSKDTWVMVSRVCVSRMQLRFGGDSWLEAEEREGVPLNHARACLVRLRMWRRRQGGASLYLRRRAILCVDTWLSTP
ncbi:defective in Cullin neddylation protein 1, partial [Mycena metata]